VHKNPDKLEARLSKTGFGRKKKPSNVQRKKLQNLALKVIDEATLSQTGQVFGTQKKILGTQSQGPAYRRIWGGYNNGITQSEKGGKESVGVKLYPPSPSEGKEEGPRFWAGCRVNEKK